MKKERFVKIKKFYEEHKNTIRIVGGGILLGCLAVIGWKASKESEPEPHTQKWYEGLSDEEWHVEREKTRLEMRDAHDDVQAADLAYFRLGKFDDEWRRRKWGGTDDEAAPIYREHGKNLYKPD